MYKRRELMAKDETHIMCACSVFVCMFAKFGRFLYAQSMIILLYIFIFGNYLQLRKNNIRNVTHSGLNNVDYLCKSIYRKDTIYQLCGINERNTR